MKALKLHLCTSMSDPVNSSQIQPPAYSAECLRQSKLRIIMNWEARARAELPAAESKTHYILIDSLPRYLDEMIEALDRKTPRLVEAKEVSEGHAHQRSAVRDYDLNQVL